MKKEKTPLQLFVISLFLIVLLSSCSITLPSFSSNRQTNGVIINHPHLQIEPLRADDYTVLKTTTGKASTGRFYFLFFPIGKHKTNEELFNSAYYEAVENLSNADAILLPRQKVKKLIIPLLLVNYMKRTVTVTGVGISVKNKILENNDTDVPYKVVNNYRLKPNTNLKKINNHKITSKIEFEKYFLESNLNGSMEKIDFSKEYVIFVSGRPSKRGSNYVVNYLRLKENTIKLSFTLEEGENQSEKKIPVLILVVDKKIQGDIIIR